MVTLERLPAWSTMGIGSLPHTSPERAVSHVAMAYDIPYCPQLPRLEGDMISEWLGADPRRCGWSPERDRVRPSAWDAFLRSVTRTPPPHRLVKLQATGPVTLAYALERAGDGDGPGGHSLAVEIGHWIASSVESRVRTLADREFSVLVVIDEPALEFADSSAGVERAWDPIRVVAPGWGLHLCCRVPWRLVASADPHLLSFDLAANPIDRVAAASLRERAKRGRWTAWGAVRVDRSEHSLHGMKRLAEALSQVGGSDALDRQSILTPSCGTGSASIARERALSVSLADMARSIRADDGANFLGGPRRPGSRHPAGGDSPLAGGI